ncbi:MAG: hypothetical protein QOJ80_807 [Mycobacterium sp.]|jgi:hypothetical protein|nr:hypothetical protein [Mycobacterium sp.]
MTALGLARGSAADAAAAFFDDALGSARVAV